MYTYITRRTAPKFIYLLSTYTITAHRTDGTEEDQFATINEHLAGSYDLHIPGVATIALPTYDGAYRVALAYHQAMHAVDLSTQTVGSADLYHEPETGR